MFKLSHFLPCNIKMEDRGIFLVDTALIKEVARLRVSVNKLLETMKRIEVDMSERFGT